MNREEILATLSSILVQALRKDPSRIKQNSRLFDDLGAESLDILDVRFRIERTFGFKIEQDEIFRFLGRELSVVEFREKLTVDSLIEFIQYRINQPAEAK